MTNLPVRYECPLAGEEHSVPGPEVRIMKVGDGGFVVACNCAEESLDDVDEAPHPTTDHLVNIYADDPSPEAWFVLEDAADGWYDTTQWDSPDGYKGTFGQRRANFREKMKEIADDNDRNKRGGADETDEKAREVPCPQCGAEAGQKCKRPSGHRVRQSHSERVDKAMDENVITDEGDGGKAAEQASLEGFA
ncbi:zinc finger domain-containing protein [Halorhabdus rudnickae]|uniref:zinc finger domain-containing protein n=1 Tax=Halorhabdus rudnickae TaxID=1775544 RepID=UPI0010845ABA|nr:hypothetical protein [Halorhabdus rudnickae]